MEPEILRQYLRKYAYVQDSVANSLPIGLVIVEKETGEIVYVNDCATELCGVDPRGLEVADHSTKLMKLLTLDGKVYPPEELPASKALRTGKKIGAELVIERPDGSRIIVDATASPIKAENGEIIGALGIFQDVTKPKKVEKALRSSEEQFRRAIKDAPIPIIMHAESGEVFQLSDSWTKLTGYSINDIPDFNTWLTKAAYGEGANAIRDHIHGLFAGHNESLNVEFPIRALDGSLRYWSFSASSPSTLRDGKRFIIGMAVDITERKKAEEALKKAKYDLNHAQAVGKIGSWRLDTQRDVLLWSDENHRIFGVPKGNSMTYESFLEIVHPDDREYVDERWKAGLKGEPYDIEHRIIVDGQIKWVRERADLEFDEGGNVKGGFGITQDITDLMETRLKLDFYRKHLEDIIEEKTNQLREAERFAAIGATAGMVGHDIRNPLQSIDGSIYLAKQTVISSSANKEEKKELLDELDLINEQVAYIDHIVADLQDFAKKTLPQIETTYIRESINHSLSMTRIPDNIQVNVVLPEDPVAFSFDPSCMKRVFVNLINNAVQAMPDGGELTIFVFLRDGWVWIRFEDTGVGIPEEVKPNIFIPLFTTKSKGQGFGLAVCKKLVEAQSGEITFESEAGKGTTFTIKLPIKQFGVDDLWRRAY